MGFHCLSACPECNRHVRCGERACPFCGAEVTSLLRVLEYRITNRLDRSRMFSLGAALAAAGFVTNCESEGGAVYGAPCNPPACIPPQAGSGGMAGEPNNPGPGGDGAGGEMSTAGAATSGEGGEPSEGGGGAQGGAGGTALGIEGGAGGVGGTGEGGTGEGGATL